MKFFDEATLRLKQQLRVTQDRDLASLLDLSPTSWAGRKKRGNFPETELYALVAKRPDLKIDVNYVLTGITAEAQARLDAKEARTKRTTDAMPNADLATLRAAELAQESVAAVLTADENNLLKAVRQCSKRAREALQNMAFAMAEERQELLVAPKLSAQPAPSSQTDAELWRMIATGMPTTPGVDATTRFTPAQFIEIVNAAFAHAKTIEATGSAAGVAQQHGAKRSDRVSRVRG